MDSSALLAILLGAPEAPALLDALVDANHPRMSVANWLEVAMLIEERGGRLASLRFDEFFRAAGIELIPVDAAQAAAARTAWRHFGRHRHSARLNFGDCFAYALAKGIALPKMTTGGLGGAARSPQCLLGCRAISAVPKGNRPRGSQRQLRGFRC